MSTILLNPMNTEKKGNSIAEKFRYEVGGNTGNLMFVESVKEQIIFDDEIDVHLPDAVEKGRKSRQSDVIVIPASNFIIHNGNSDKFYQNFINFIEATKCPVVMIGLGAQGSKTYNTPRKLTEKGLSALQVKFLKTVSDHSVSIGIRGDFTAECLELLGIKNYRVIGCPSFYKHRDGFFPKIKTPSCANVQFNVTPGAEGNSSLFRIGIKNGYKWIEQTYGEFPRTINVCGTNVVSPKWRLRNYPTLFVPSKELLSYHDKCAHVFFDLESWDNFYKENNISFTFGSRFHGNMIALRNGVPTLWLTHDSRTRELTEFMHLPRVDIKEVDKVRSAEDLVQYCNYEDTAANYNRLCRNYVEFLDENHVDHKFKLK